MKVYIYVKYLGTLWLSSLAEKYPNIRFASVGRKADTLIGTWVDQEEILESLTNKMYQQNVNEIVNELIKA